MRQYEYFLDIEEDRNNDISVPVYIYFASHVGSEIDTNSKATV